MTIEDQLRDALAEHAGTVGPLPDRWAEIETRAAAAGSNSARRQSRRRGRIYVVVGLAAGAAALIALPALRHSTGHRVATTPGAGTPAASTPGVSNPAGQPSPTNTTPPTRPGATTATTAPALAGYQALWPFADQAAADAWRARHQATGGQPWHLDAAQTALNFSQGYLGYTDITTAFGTRTDTKGTHVTVGFPNPNGQPVNAAVIHLVRFGSAADAPWEVVGTDDTDLSLTTPHYGATVSSPLTVGGRITGVDENIKVEVLQLSSTTALGVSAGTPAGGVNSPWSTTVSFLGATERVLTVAASTGGHLARVERFTITGVQPAGR